jgi:PAS domain S-box-containing protein
LKTSIRNKLFIGFALAVGFLLFFTVVTFINMNKLKNDSKEQFESYLLLKDIEDLYVSIIEVESNCRGFAITGNNSFLDYYDSNLKQIESKLKILNLLAVKQKIDSNPLKELRLLIREKIDFCNKTIRLRNEFGEAESLALIRSEKGKILTTKIRLVLKNIEEKERIYLYKANELQIKSADFTILIFAILCFIIISILGLVYYYYSSDEDEKKLAEQRLQEAKEQLQDILDNTNSLVFIKNLEGKFIFVNKPFERKVKLTSQFILGHTDYDFYAKETADRFWESDNETILKKTHIEFDGVVPEKEGLTYYHTLKFPLYDNENKMYGICGITTDVTRKKEIEEKLEATKDQLQSILDNTNSLVAIRSTDGVYLFVNKEYEKLFHVTEANILGKTLFEFFPKETADEIFKHDVEVIKAQQLKEYEVNFLVDDEIHTAITSKFPLYDSSNNIYAVCAVSTDITERRKAEEKLEKAYILQNAILNGTDYSIIATDANGKIIEFNKASEEMLGYTALELLNRHTPEIFFDQSVLNAYGFDQKNNQTKVLDELRSLNKPNVLETIYLSKKGKRIPVLLSVSVLRDGNDETTGYLGIAQDISIQKAAEKKLQESQQLFQNMSSNVPGVIFRYMLMPNGKREFTYVSSGIKELFEIEAEELKKEPTIIWEALAKEDVDLFFKGMLHSAKTLQPFSFETKANLKSGKFKWIKSLARPEKMDNGNIVWDGVMMDISEQKLVEFELKQSEERYEIAVQGANDGLWDWNLETNEVYFSPRWKSMLGYQEHEIVNSVDSFSKLLHPDSVENVFQVVNNYIDGKSKIYEIELQLLHKKGYYQWVLARGAVLRNNKGKAYRFAGSHTDIMERKFQEVALRSSEAKFRAMNDASPLGVFVTDTKGNCVYTNLSYQKITGYAPENLLGTGWLKAIHKEDLEQVKKSWFEATEHKKKYESIHRFVQPNGTAVWTSVKAAEMIDNNKIIGYVGTVDDLTVMKDAEEKIIQSTYMINNATDAIIASDLNWSINSYNNAAQNIYGFTADEVIGKIAEDVLLTDFVGSSKREFLLALKYKGSWSGEVVQKRKDGTFVPILSSLSINRDNQGNAIGYLAVNRDITERKKREEIIGKLNVELEQNLMELEMTNRELESFSYTISHDLRAPLRAIDGFTQILKEDYIANFDSEAIRLMDVVMSNAKKMGQLIDDLLHFSRLSKQEIIKTDVNMQAIVESTIADFKNSQPDLAVTFKINSMPNAKSDISTIKQVWINLISNAIKYSSTKPNPKIEIGYIDKIDVGVYFIKDNGVGFNMNYYDKLFGVFQRLHNDEFDGTGVGLAIVQRIIQKNGGKVWADAKVNKGATFYFSLPK